MRYLIIALTAVAATIGAVILASMGMDYMNENIGYGLHPGIAFPLATLLLCAVGVLTLIIAHLDDASDDLPEWEQYRIAAVAERKAKMDLMVKHY